MAKALMEPFIHKGHDNSKGIYIFCPGCYDWYKRQHPDDPRYWVSGCVHCMSLDIHAFDGNFDEPTFSPSLLARSEAGTCHSYIRQGKIEYLGDCTHAFAGRTVDLLDSAEWEAAHP